MAKTKTEKQERGALTERIKVKSLALMGYIITTTELRLMPYIQYCMLNDQKIDSNKVNAQESAILGKWKRMGWIEGNASKLTITKEFWDIINELIYLGYVDID